MVKYHHRISFFYKLIHEAVINTGFPHEYHCVKTEEECIFNVP